MKKIYLALLAAPCMLINSNLTAAEKHPDDKIYPSPTPPHTQGAQQPGPYTLVAIEMRMTSITGTAFPPIDVTIIGRSFPDEFIPTTVTSNVLTAQECGELLQDLQ